MFKIRLDTRGVMDTRDQDVPELSAKRQKVHEAQVLWLCKDEHCLGPNMTGIPAQDCEGNDIIYENDPPGRRCYNCDLPCILRPYYPDS